MPVRQRTGKAPKAKGPTVTEKMPDLLTAKLDSLTPEQLEMIKQRRAQEGEVKMTKGEIAMLLASFAAMVTLTSGLMIGIAWYFGARFDLAWERLFTNQPKTPAP
ncbi:uncharacterized protein V1510DRAFT_403170 [Dipodascopsis tothii]|uniref:uncharacterized protein n=1 Tax=Dipodascopsis tothii TaxID=44089 RepID=UPI0034CE013F